MNAQIKRRRLTFPVVLALIVAVLTGAYVVYWFWMGGEVRKGVENWIAEERARGATVSYSDMSLGGFPYRFTLTFTDPELSYPHTGPEWQGETLQLVSMAWNLNHIIAKSPGENTLTEGGRATSWIADDAAAASFIFSEGVLSRVGFSAETLTLTDDYGQTTDLEGVTFGARPLPDTPNTIQASLEVTNMVLPEAPTDAPWLGTEANNLVLWLEVENGYDVIRGAKTSYRWLEGSDKIELRRAEIDWGPLDLASRASLDFNPSYEPTGTLGINLEDPETLLGALREAGVADMGTQLAIMGIGTISQNGEFATAELRDGEVFFAGQRVRF